MKEKVKRWKEKVREATEAAYELGAEIQALLRPIIPDLEFTVGWAEGGVDELCFWSSSRSVNVTGGFGYRRLGSLLEELLGIGPDSEVQIDTPFGVYITEDEAEQIRRIIEGASNGSDVQG